MDGSNAAFLLHPPLMTPAGGAPPPRGILYVEDFDADPAGLPAADDVPPAAATLSGDELEAAQELGRQRGLEAALADARLIQAQLQVAATQALADRLATAQALLAQIVERHAADISQTILAILQAAVPATMRLHARDELHAVAAALAPGLAHEPELRVRAHPDLADFVRETVMSLLPASRLAVSVCADPSLGAGDVLLAWQDGHARRDCARIWRDITAALAPLNLPNLEEIDHGCGL